MPKRTAFFLPTAFDKNPRGTKAAMAAMGYGENYLRLPLTPMSKDKEATLLSLMKAEGLIG